MSFIRYKRFGNKEYAYEITAYWDPVEKKPRQKTRYLGLVVDKEKGVYKRKEPKERPEKLILDFGDVHLLYEFMKQADLVSLLDRIFGDKTRYLLALLCYRLCYASAMSYAGVWYEGSISRFLFRDVNLSSQRISDFLKSIGEERVQRDFFERYLAPFMDAKEGVIIDTTALPNQIHFPFNAWGYDDGEIDKQVRFLFVVDKDSSLPLFFRYLPGNVVDVSTLGTTVEELKKLGVKTSFFLLDAGFFSEDNIKGLQREKVDFLMRMPSGKLIYKELIKRETGDLESFDNAVRCGERALFIKQKRITLYGKKAYAHIVLDPERKGRETRELLLNAMEQPEDKKDIEFKLRKKGMMILVSSFKLEKEEAVPFYYMRQAVERLFGFSKDDLRLIPLRVHKEETLRGYLLLMFMALVVFVLLKKAIGKKHTVEEVLLTMRNLKCKVYDNEILIPELTKRQKEFVERLGIIVPKKMGI
jgi:Transposase